MKLNDKKALQKLREGINENLAEFAAENGIAITADKIGYETDGTSCRVTLQVVAADATGKIVTQEELDFRRHAEIFGLSQQDFGAIIRRRDGDVKIVGLQISRRKFPVVVEYCETGKRVLIEAREVTTKLRAGDRVKAETADDLVPPRGGLTLHEPPPRS